jgi:NAD(P)-dependent dehydrogenase (short-subunit alcohol dehydrogenase family)
VRADTAPAESTGADCSIGRAVALPYAREGADVAIVHLPDEQGDAEQVRREVEEHGRRCLLLPGDRVSNAAYLNSKLELEQLTAEDFDRPFKINVYAYLHLPRQTPTCRWTVWPGSGATRPWDAQHSRRR